MWICSKLGFFSIVKKGKPETWQVRARRMNDLTELLKATSIEAEIVSTPNRDYGFRVMVDRDSLDCIFSSLADSIDYPNFKDCIADLPEQRDKLPAYEDFWSGMRKDQKAALSSKAGSQRTKARTREQVFKMNGGFWMRFLIAIGSFKARYGHWPTRLHLSKAHIQELRDVHWTPHGFKEFESKLRLIAGDTDKYVAEDDAGHCFDYERNHAEGEAPQDSAARWLWGIDMNEIPVLPFKRAYWADSGRLLAGCYPGDLDHEEARRKLQGLIDCGVGRIISLMEATEVGLGGKPFVDYRPALEALAREAGRVIQCERLPIPDMGVPAVAQMQRILDTIDDANAAGQVVYVHCWGGKGRTGTVVGCFLARHGLAVGDAALKRLNELTKAAPFDFGYVPQTSEQCAFVRNWGQGQ